LVKNLVVCCDGTANGLTRNRTNVIRMWLSVERDPDQIAYYDPGVGTLGSPGGLTKLRRRLDRAIDMATGTSLRQNVLEAYEFLMETYEQGDRLFLFGFSRGAYTARVLAGILDMFGLMPKGSKNLLPYVWQIYSNDEQDVGSIGKRFELANALKRLNRKPTVQFLGVWDTVSSWGWFFNFKSLPRTAYYEHVEQICHAVALDERRAAFRQNRFRARSQGLLEVWFPGVHSDVGGGYTEAEGGLAKAAFAWMVLQAKTQGLRFNEKTLQELLGGESSRQPHRSLRGLWWILEYFPRRTWKATDDGRGRHVWRLNQGRPRFVPPDAKRHEEPVSLERVSA